MYFKGLVRVGAACFAVAPVFLYGAPAGATTMAAESFETAQTSWSLERSPGKAELPGVLWSAIRSPISIGSPVARADSRESLAAIERYAFITQAWHRGEERHDHGDRHQGGSYDRGSSDCVSPVPLPASLWLLIAGAATLLARVRSGDRVLA